jgi:type IV secretion system protein TrbL
MPLGLDELIGALPDAIAWAIAQVIKAVSGEVISQIIDYGFGPLLEISNPMGNADALAAWDQTAGIAIALLPLMVAGSLIAMPFSDDRDTSLWGLVLRGVGILFFIAISKPLWGFAIDATNAVTVELLPASFKLTFANDLLDGWGTLLGIFLYPIMAVMMFSAFILSEILLVLRWFLVWVVFIGSPLFAVLWYPNKGPLKSVSKFAAVFLRMGVYALLAGPVIAIVLKVFSVIMTGGVITGQGGVAGTIHELGVSIVLVLLMPLVLFVVVYKVISWAGQPMGVGDAFGMAIAATVAAVGAATVIGGGVAAGGAGAAAGGAGAAGGGSAGGGAAAGAGVGGSSGAAGASAGSAGGGAIDPSAATDNSTIGSGLRQSIGDSLSTNLNESQAEADAPSPGERIGTWAKSKKPEPFGGRVTDGINGGLRGFSGWAKQVGTKGGRFATGSSVVDTMRSREAGYAEQAATHQANAGFLNRARETGEIDIQEAANRGLVNPGAEPNQDVSTIPVEKVGENSGGQGVYAANYETADGRQETFDVTGTHDTEIERANVAAMTSDRWARRTSDARTAGRGIKRVARTTGTTGKAGGKVVVASGKIGAAAMLGGATRSPYLSHRIGRSIGGSAPTSRAKNALIGSNVENPTQSLDDHADGSTGTSSAVAIESERATDHALSKDHRVESDAQSQDIDESGAF